jgi:S-adenosyl methyltransferase
MTTAAAEPGRPEQPTIDTSRPHQARIYACWLGGKDNFAGDREAAERALAAYPGLRRGVRAQRAFLASAVDYLARTEGIRQCLDIGTGIPTANNSTRLPSASTRTPGSSTSTTTPWC